MEKNWHYRMASFDEWKISSVRRKIQ